MQYLSDLEAFKEFLGTHVYPFLAKLPGALLLLLALWVVGKIVAGSIRRLGVARNLDPDLTRILASSLSLTLTAVGVIMALGTIGVDVTALVAGLGLTGFALGFALKDIISNALAGVLLLLYETINQKDRIKVAGFEGVVREITLRYTVLEADDQSTIYVPNSLLFNNAVVVNGAVQDPTSKQAV